MSLPAPAALFAALDATWPAAEVQDCGPFRLRRGAGGGKRVSAITCEGDWQEADIAAAEAGMRAMGQPPLFMIRPGDAALDAALAARGHALVDPVVVLAAPVAAIAAHAPPGMACLSVGRSLAIMREIWAAGGIGPGRLQVMARAAGPCRSFLARQNDRPAGVAFAAMADRIAMLHALHVLAEMRRQGVAQNILGRAAEWAQHAGAEWFSVVTTGENMPALRLFSGLGMQAVANYHYRLWITPGTVSR